MRATRSAIALVLVLASGCAASQSHATSAAAANSADSKGKWREMTWSEYYADVREKAWRNNATVYWVNPPQVFPAKRNVKAAPKP